MWTGELGRKLRACIDCCTEGLALATGINYLRKPVTDNPRAGEGAESIDAESGVEILQIIN